MYVFRESVQQIQRAEPTERGLNSQHLRERIDCEFAQHPLIQQLAVMGERDIDGDRPNRFPFHGLDHFQNVAVNSSRIAVRLYLSDEEFRNAAVGMLDLEHLSEEEKLVAIEMTFYICGLYHDTGCFYGDDGAMIDLRRDRLNRDGHEDRSFEILARVVSNESSGVKRVLEILNLDEEKYLATASLLIGATEVDFTTSTPAIFHPKNWSKMIPRKEYDRFLQFASLFCAPMILADLPFAPLPEIWGCVEESVTKLVEAKGGDPKAVFQEVYELTLMVNHILFLLENSCDISTIGADTNLGVISPLIRKTIANIGSPVSASFLLDIDAVDPTQISIRSVKRYLEGFENLGIMGDILKLSHFAKGHTQALIHLHHLPC